MRANGCDGGFDAVGLRLGRLWRFATIVLTCVLLGPPVGAVAQAICGDSATQRCAVQTDAGEPLAVVPGPAQSMARSHDWRDPGYPAVVGGQIFDPLCVPLESVGSNVLNLPFRTNQDEELEWMRTHSVRWMRVLATGHGLADNRTPHDVAATLAALRALLTRVEAFNAAHEPTQWIYVLIGLTDYYPPGVPGERRVYDNPFFNDVPVLPAPWYRAGVPLFDFEQYHGFGVSTAVPNYQGLYKPWVETLVSGLADRPSLLGWQVGNELKSRASAPNGITPDQAYAWYLAFTRDIVDTIRARDRHHLIFTGTQYVAELTDWEYRPRADLAPDLVSGYRQRHQQLLDACAQWCWNVLGLTYYDFNPYALDDALLARLARVAVSMTEYGFTDRPTDSVADRQARYGGNRAAAVSSGLGRPWKALDGSLQPFFASAADLVGNGTINGLAPWGSPSPWSGPDRGLDLDGQRGVTDAPDAVQLWAAWAQTGARLEIANRAAGVSSTCLATRTT